MQSIEVISADYGQKDYPMIRDYPLTMYKDEYDKFTDPRRNSRIHKILIHKYSDADVTIWHDANINLLHPPEEIVEKYLGDYDMAMFKHGGRDCIYDEAMVVAKLGLDNVETIIEQAKYYEDRGFPKHYGLATGCFIIRRNNAKTQELNEAWWADYCRFSRRDQLSLMPAIKKTGVKFNLLSGTWVQYADCAVMDDAFSVVQHAHHEGNWNEQK